MEKKMLDAKISIIIPIYNAEHTLYKCVMTVLKQTYHNLQIILINDGSTDGSNEICERLVFMDKRIEVYHTDNNGSVLARKEGLKKAIGDYIGFVDADDFIEPDMFYKLLKVLIKTNADFVHSGYIEEQENISRIICNFDETVIEMDDIRSRILFLQRYVLNEINDYNISSGIWSKLYRADFIKKCFKDLSNKQQYGEDLLCLCRCVFECRCIALNKTTGYHYAINKHSLSHLDYDDYMMKEIGLWHHTLKILEEYGVLGTIKRDIYGYFKHRMIHVILRDEQKKIPIPRYYLKNIKTIIGKKVVIWGAGAVGQDYYLQISKYDNCKIIAWVDSNWKKYHYDYAEVLSAERIFSILCDLIIIAIRSEDTRIKIKEELEKNGIPVQKIIWREPGEYY